VRRFILPEVGKIFLEVDLSAAEARVVYALTGDAKLLEVARSKPTELDIHVRNARLLLQKHDITPLERQICKSVKHGVNYGEGALRISDELLKDGIIRTADELEPLVAMAREEPILAWQHRVEEQVIEKGYLTTNWGRRISFRGDKLGPDIYRTAYAYEPSSTVVDIMNQWGLIPLRQELKHGAWRAVINHQGHDSMTVSVDPSEAYDIALFLRDSLERPRLYFDGHATHELTIPATFKVGANWGESLEFKTLPDRAEFLTAAHEAFNKSDHAA
jgi:DNA polymerase I-like protein with 3'-5' exonuclease and polymerase domains